MAASPPRRRNRVSVVVSDAKKQAYLVFSLKMKHIFSDRPDESDYEVQRYFPPTALALFELVDCCEHMGFAHHGANKVIAVTSRARTVVYDADSDSVSPGPALCAAKNGPILVRIAIGDGASFFAMSRDLYRAGPHFESLDLAAAGSASAWRAIPDLPGPVSKIMASGCSEVTAYFVAGTRVWLSVQGMGTFSLDMVSREWRKEGTWLLPVVGRAIVVPELEGLLFGFVSGDARWLCACDIEARPPVIRVRWEDGDAYPREWCGRNGYGMDPCPAGLAYFGGGRFCTSSKMSNHSETISFLCIMALQVTTNLQLIKRRFRCYLMEPHQEIAYFI